jgi:outer membrane protein assembly factor BamB
VPKSLALVLLVGLLAASAQAAEPVVKWRYSFNGPVYGGVTLADLNGDQRPEILFATRDGGQVFALKGDGAPLFAFTPGGGERFISAVSAADIDGDGQVEIVATGRDRAVYCLSADGRPRWTTRLPNGGPAFGGPTLADLNGGGRLEILFGTDSGRLYCLDPSGRILWTYQAGAGIFDMPVVADVDGDGQPDILFGCNDNNVYCLDATGALKWRSPTDKEAAGGPVVADLEGDGTPEVLACGFDGIVRCLSGKDGAPLWKYQTGGPLRNSISVADLNGDGALEVLVSGYKALFCLGASGKPLWIFKPPGVEPRAETAAAVVGDVTGGGKPDVIFAGKNGHIYCLDASGKLLWERGSEVDYISASPALGDVDGDGKVEILYAGSRSLVCLGTDAPYDPKACPWPQARRTATLDASLSQSGRRPVGEVVTEVKADLTAPGININFAALPTYPSYSALGVTQAYIGATPDTGLKDRTVKVEITRSGTPIYARSDSARGDRGALVLDLPLGQLMDGSAPEHAVRVQVVAADGKVEAQSTLTARLLFAEPIARRAADTTAALNRLAEHVGEPPANSPAEFAARLLRAAQFYTSWVREDIASGDLRAADKHITGLEAALPELERRLGERAGETTPVEAPGLKPDHIAFRQNVLLVDGKPAFGYGMYNMDTAKHIAALAPSFNVAVGAGDDAYWKAAADQRLLVITYLGGEAMEDFGNLLVNADRIEKLSREPALLAWYVADEPSLRGVSVATMKRLCDAVKILDPYHPTLICDGSPNGGWEYNAACDLPMPASYPLWKGIPVIEVADCLDRNVAAVKDQKPIWFVIQAFTGRGVRLPTAAEERSMTYLAIIHGARGLTYFTYREPEAPLPGDNFFMISQSAPETWKAMLDLAREIKTLEPVLTVPQRRLEIVEKEEFRLDTCVIATADAVWILAASPLQGKTHWRLAPKELAGKSGAATLPFENRSLAFANGAFEDDFESLGVHVYRIPSPAPSPSAKPGG